MRNIKGQAVRIQGCRPPENTQRQAETTIPQSYALPGPYGTDLFWGSNSLLNP